MNIDECCHPYCIAPTLSPNHRRIRYATVTHPPAIPSVQRKRRHTFSLFSNNKGFQALVFFGNLERLQSGVFVLLQVFAFILLSFDARDVYPPPPLPNEKYLNIRWNVSCLDYTACLFSSILDRLVNVFPRTKALTTETKLSSILSIRLSLNLS